ncbi:hypothetical protein FN976_19245 [Caenimonas sedimenti]|uniref:Uncharacterized protein n=1 Tax=Caenimonas sedimenti TaxID=2596921 RepID=A0A562ZM74_9BURK|nr:hypothetical protein [Caenimonas sedimenti]TWO69425.1 hypothetical protein FN976_19245 [Caenimonas sedimenti]
MMGPLAQTSRRWVAGALAAVLLAGCGGTGPLQSELTPGQPIALQNPGFTADPNGRMPGWSQIEHMGGESYTFVADTEHFALSAPSSLRMRRHGREFFGLMEQRVRMQPAWAGKTVRLSGFMRSRGATGTGGALLLQSRDGYDNIVRDERMAGRRVRGDTEWRQYAVEMKLPPSTWWIQVGVMLEDDGTLWADDIVLEIID